MNRTLVCILIINILTINGATAVQLNKSAPEFALPDIEGNALVNLKDYHGKVVYLDFWASWCLPCRASFPLLDQLYQRYREKGLEIVAINLDEDDSSLNRFKQRYPVSFTLVRDKNALTPQKYQVEAMPSSFIIDKKGNIRHIHKGFRKNDIERIEQQLSMLLNE